MLGVSQCDLHTATSNQQSSRSPEVAAGSVAGIHPNQRHPRGAVDRISPSRELKGRVRETYDVDFTEGPPTSGPLYLLPHVCMSRARKSHLVGATQKSMSDILPSDSASNPLSGSDLARGAPPALDGAPQQPFLSTPPGLQHDQQRHANMHE